MRTPLLIAAAMSMATAAHTDAVELHLSLIETGTRDYYCTAKLQLKNASDVTVNDINGSLRLFDGRTAVAESRSNSFWNVAPGAKAEIVFETPDGPCAEIGAYNFVVGACRIDGSFLDQADCVAQINASEPILKVVARSSID